MKKRKKSVPKSHKFRFFNYKVIVPILILVAVLVVIISFSLFKKSVYFSPISSCGEISSPGIYVLQSDIDNYPGTCFNITSDNVVLDGNGKHIDGTGVGIGIFAGGRRNITIYNLTILNFADGIFFTNTSQSFIQEVISNNNSKTGFFLYYNSSNNTLTNLKAQDNQDIGIYIYWFSENNRVNNAILERNGAGITLSFKTRKNIFTNIFSSNNFGSGVYFYSTLSNMLPEENLIINLTANNNSDYAVIFNRGINNIIINSIMSNNRIGTIYDSGEDYNEPNSLIYNNSFGEINWSSDHLATNNSLTFPGNISLLSNSAFYTSGGVGFTDRLNSSAEITLYGLPRNFINPRILKNGFNCTDCYNFTSLNAGTVRFNVSSWSNYSIAGDPISYLLTQCTNIAFPGIYVLQSDIDNYPGTCFNITSDNVVLDGNGKHIDGVNIDGKEDYGVFSDGKTNITIRNFAFISEFGDYNHSSSLFGSGIYFRNINNSIIENITTINNLKGLSLYLSSNNTLKNIISYNNDVGIFFENSNNNNTLKNIISYNNLGGFLFMLNSNNNFLDNITSNNNSNYGFYFYLSRYNSLINPQVYNNIRNSFFSSPLTANSLIYNNSFGEIHWNNIDLTSINNLTFPGTIRLSSNFVEYTSSNNDSLNSSANITLYSLSTTFIDPVILKNGYRCTDCYNFTSLNAGTVRFNVLSWSNYSIACSNEDCTPPRTCVPSASLECSNSTNLRWINISSDCTNVTIDYLCPYGCSSGACTPPRTCTPSLTKTCSNSTNLREINTSSDCTNVTIDYLCPYGCSSGACTPPSYPLCFDSDFGLNYIVKANISYFESIGSLEIKYSDNCINSSHLKEYFCNNSLIEFREVPCEYVVVSNSTCVNGACTYFCNENWSCSDWGGCSNNQQTRTCIDNNSCGTTLFKPAESQSCSTPGGGGYSGGSGGGAIIIKKKVCTQSWNCNYGPCQNNIQKYICTDNNNCGNNTGKPRLADRQCSVQSNCIDNDRDGFGIGVDCLGTDYDDNDPNVTNVPRDEIGKGGETIWIISIGILSVWIVILVILIVAVILVRRNPRKARKLIFNAKDRVNQLRKMGKKDSEIKELFSKKGWSESDISRLLSEK